MGKTLTEIAVEKNSTIIFPLPIDLLTILRSMVTSLPMVSTPEASVPALTTPATSAPDVAVG